MAPRLRISDRIWRVTHIDRDGTLAAIDDADAPTLEFAADQAGGSTGVNRWFGPVRLGATEVAFGAVGTTLAAGSEPLVAQERAWLAVLEATDSYAIAGGTLEMRTGDEVLALLIAVPDTMEGDWELTGISTGTGVASLVPGTVITARFEDGIMSGSSGCNRYRAGYTTEGSGISLAPGMGTRMHCQEPDGVMEQEQRFLELFAAAAAFERRDGTILAISDAEGALLLQFRQDD